MHVNQSCHSTKTQVNTQTLRPGVKLAWRLFGFFSSKSVQAGLVRVVDWTTGMDLESAVIKQSPTG